MLTSNSIQTWTFKYLRYIIGMPLFAVGIYMALKPIPIELNEFESIKTNHYDAIIVMSLAIILILTNLLYGRKIKIVSISYSKLIVQNGEDFTEYNWDEIEELKRVRFVSPPLYKLTIKDTFEEVLFTTESRRGSYKEINTPFMSFTFDPSKMGKLIKRIKNTYGI